VFVPQASLPRGRPQEDSPRGEDPGFYPTAHMPRGRDPGDLRRSSLEDSRYARSSRLGGRAPRSGPAPRSTVTGH